MYVNVNEKIFVDSTNVLYDFLQCSKQLRYRHRGHRLSTNHDGPNGQKSPHQPFNFLHRYDVTVSSSVRVEGAFRH